MVFNIFARLAGMSLHLGLGNSSVYSSQESPLRGEDKVRWEDMWYPLEDGAQKKLMVRRGIGQKGLWTQFRNDYHEKINCCATVVSTLSNGEKVRAQFSPQIEPGAVEVHCDHRGDEINKVEISEVNFGESPAKTV